MYNLFNRLVIESPRLLAYESDLIPNVMHTNCGKQNTSRVFSNPMFVYLAHTYKQDRNIYKGSNCNYIIATREIEGILPGIVM